MVFAGRVPICIACGSGDVHPQTTGEGLWPGGGEGTAWVCDACHHIGAPLLNDEVAADGDAADRLFLDDVAAAEGPDDAGVVAAPTRTALRFFAGALVALGAAFWIPALLGLQAATAEGGAVGLLGALLPLAWLGGVGTVLLAIGSRLLRRPA